MNETDFIEFAKKCKEDGVSPSDAIQELGLAFDVPICPFCQKRDATLLCDRVIGFLWKGESKNGVRFCSEDSEMFTCDRPICSECAKHEGMMHFSGKESGFQSIDKCPVCVDDYQPSGDYEPLLKVLTIDEVNRERMRIHNTRPNPKVIGTKP